MFARGYNPSGPIGHSLLFHPTAPAARIAWDDAIRSWVKKRAPQYPQGEGLIDIYKYNII